MFSISQGQTKGIRTDRGPKFIGPEFLQSIVNYNFDNIIGLSRILAPAVEYDNGGTDGIDGIFQFRYIDSSGSLQKENIIVTGGNVIKDGVDSVLSPTTIYTGLTAGNKCSFAVLNDKLFITNGVDNVLVYNGTVVYEMGAPIATNNNVAGVLTGDYFYAITYFIDGVESVTSCVSNTVSPSSNAIDLTLPIGPTGTTERDIYRTEAGGTQLKFLHKVNNNTTTTYQDNIADGSLNDDIPATNAPAPKPTFITVKNERLIGIGNSRRPNYLYRSETELESLFATIGVTDVSGQGNDNTGLVGMAEDYNQIIVFSEKRIYLVDVSGEAATVKQTNSNVGCLDGHTIAKVPQNVDFKGGLMFVSDQYDIRVFNGEIAVNLATSFDNLATQNFSAALNKDQLKNSLKNIDLEAAFFDYKYHLIVGNLIYVYDIRIQGWTTYRIRTESYAPTYSKFGTLGDKFYIGQSDTAIVEEMYRNEQYRSENFDASFETGEIGVDDSYKLFSNLVIYYGNSGDVTTTLTITPESNSNLAQNLNFSISADAYNSTYYNSTYYETASNLDDYKTAHINVYAKWIRFRFFSSNRFNYRGYKLTGDQLSNKEV
jgi:hypothetical protein